ncbi:MAG TPA: 3-keto-5-aminohexanoate cleavage protein [Steroidobacter sp.]|uniref:3-keto-5-aminohexanoate cleavage protein n=1 Tax=Steroidobacter sp. TaxID=1978227 RepID=UPI002EDA6C31
MQNSNRKIILTCAVTGNAPFNRKHPAFPVTPAEIAAACIEAAKAGAAIVHVHVRDPRTGEGSRDPRLFKETVDRIRDSQVDVVINLTAGLGGLFLPDPADESRALPQSDVIGVEQRVVHLELARPEIASLDITTGNQVEGDQEFVYLNTTRTLRAMAKRFQELNVKPELEVFGPGDIEFGKQMAREGLISGRPLYQFVLGVKWGAPADTRTMLYMKELLPPDALWAALGIGRLQMPIMAQAALLGGNVRVGLEDNLYLSRGVFATNGQLVERARTILEGLGHELATPGEARQILGLAT